MAHDLATIGDATAMFYHGEVPWHKLGTRLDRPATAAEAIKAAKLDWTVRKAPIHILQDGQYRAAKGKFATVRTDPSRPTDTLVLGIVGEQYTPLQNIDAFGWFDSVVGEKAAIYETAGALGEGERVWILAKLPERIRVIGDDLVDKYLLLSNSHDGSSSVQVKFTPIRVVCQNTLTMALRDGPGLRIHHNPSLKRNLDLAQVNLGLINKRFSKIEEAFKRIQRVALDQARLESYLAAVFPLPVSMDDEAGKKRAMDARSRSSELFETGYGNAQTGVRGTLWAAYNGVAELVDHHPGHRATVNGRLESSWFGSGYLTKVRAYSKALEFAATWRN